MRRGGLPLNGSCDGDAEFFDAMVLSCNLLFFFVLGWLRASPDSWVLVQDMTSSVVP